MFISKKLSFIYSAVRGLSLLLILSLSLIFGCTGRPDTEPETELPVIPLVYLSPFIGNETEIRTPPPEPERISVREESVEGWLAPDEGVLRFPVRIMNGARLSLRLGANYDLKGQSAKAPNFTATIEYHSEIPPKPSETGETPSPVIYEFSLEQKSQCFFNWQEVDISLDNFPPGKGEIRFIADGLETDEGTIRLMWGHPTVYHPDKRRHKNILLIGVDTLRADSLSIYGGRPEVSPNLELFSQTSTTFMQARSQSSWTLPSFASMVTGHLPSTIGAVEYSGHLPQRATTLGEILRPMGYATQTICTNAWLGNRQSGFEQGMDGIWYRNDPPAQTAIHQVYEFIMRSMGRDWFCFIHLMDPHAPFNPPRAMLDQIGGNESEGPYKYKFDAIDQWKALDSPPPENEIQQVKTLYEAEVANVDIALKELFDFLRLNGLFENTLIIFSADHGEEFFEHGGFEHGHTLYDELVHMPLIISGDGFPPGIQIETPVGNTDIFPSILDFIGMPIPDGLEGVPLQSVIKGVIPEDRPIYGEGVTRGTHKKFIIQWPYKCVFDYVTRTATLFDLEIDPDELTDISEDNKELALILVAKMAETMLPDQTAFHLWVTVSHHESPKRFSGTLKIPGGIESVEGFLLTDDDRYSIDSDTISFDFSSLNNIQGLYRHLVIIPAEGAETLEASLLVDGAVDAKRFYPYGTNVPEPSGSAMVSIDDYPLGPELPPALDTIPAACFIWGVRGYERQDVAIMHDPETEEQLRALGYLGGNL